MTAASFASALVLWGSTLLLAGLSPGLARAESASIFDMRKSLPLDPTEIATREFYVNAGPESGLKAGMYVHVVRLVPVHDPIGNKAQATMTVPVGSIRVIHSERGISVARPFTELTDEERPTLDYEGIMIGDRLDLASATMDEPRGSKKRPLRRPSAAFDGSPAESAAVPIAVPAVLPPGKAAPPAAASPALPATTAASL